MMLMNLCSFLARLERWTAHPEGQAGQGDDPEGVCDQDLRENPSCD